MIAALVVFAIIVFPSFIRCAYFTIWVTPKWIVYIIPRWVILKIIGKPTRPLSPKPKEKLSSIGRWFQNTAQGKKQAPDMEMLIESINNLIIEIRQDRDEREQPKAR